MLPRPGAADGRGSDGGGYKKKKRKRSQAITPLLEGLLRENAVVVDTELIRVNFVREENGARKQERGGERERERESRGSLAVQLRPVVILAPAPGVMFVASMEDPYSSLCFSLGATLAPTSVGWSRKRISIPFCSVRINALAKRNGVISTDFYARIEKSHFARKLKPELENVDLQRSSAL